MKDNFEYINISFVLEKLNYAEFDINEFEKIQDSLKKIENLKLFIEIIERNSIQVLTYTRIKYYFPKIFNNLIKIANWNFQYLKYQNRFLRQNSYIQKVLEASKAQGIKVVFLKGFCFSQCLYSEKFYKKMNDIDILIEEKYIHAFEGILKNNKFTCLFKNLFSKKLDLTKTHHLPPYISDDKICVISVHWGLSSNLLLNKIQNSLWLNLVPITNFQNSFRMSWEHNLFHLCIHLPLFKVGIKELADIFNVIKFGKPLDFSKFKILISDSSSHDKIFRSLIITSQLFPELKNNTFFLETILWCEKFVSKKIIQLIKKRTISLKFLLTARTTYITKIEKNFLLFRLSKSYKNKFKIWIKMWILLFFIPAEEIKCISGYLGNNTFAMFYYKILTPISIIKVLCSEHGTKNIFIFTLANVLTIIAGILKFSFLERETEEYDLKLLNLYKEME
ncbi:nucleotidyltransferase family protein [Pigmentibacter sp. JX0631]|uniref:nucleotidyltransferase family protein n=1 Tax=Pigmentibacter sp. JX0631 TaxID=2976982 RepID=UPI0024682E3B|nr:nucleotidyltransferase family protein [Pigmentibacter sp. JX0631]WGL60601.1 nucleotidyltransferase family protein [Pigmentibacter sp. JX0631]